ncbi:hypothetical protein NLJ89_g9528 [Agrocybe chaxingu]|uniref:Uncharacterized protein n=1 Tax=Agrocybe chaxingu TaxID=84603 RepID=A0A9W8JT91_9AGAR|nr:hypothetical protein NLJ89_g9528 [Agrocybe chaxingu]
MTEALLNKEHTPPPPTRTSILKPCFKQTFSLEMKPSETMAMHRRPPRHLSQVDVSLFIFKSTNSLPNPLNDQPTMHGVVQFSTRTFSLPLLPNITLRSWIDEDGQHPKSPNITDLNSMATLLRVGRLKLLKRVFYVTGTNKHNLCVWTGERYLQDVYARQRGAGVQIRFINSDGEWAQYGVRYLIEPEPAGSLYRVGRRVPLSTSDLGFAWGGSDDLSAAGHMAPRTARR